MKAKDNSKAGARAKPKFRDYTVGGPEADLASKKGLASGDWVLPQVDRKVMRKLMQRDDHHALKDTALLFAILLVTGVSSYCFWRQSMYKCFALSFWIYCTFYTSAADSRWHECGHGTAFKTRWMNDVLYQVASFMVFREPRVWRFSHARHHTDTSVVGRDPEIDARPLDMWSLFLAFFNVQGIQAECGKIWRHALGQMSPAEKSFVPRSEAAMVFMQARIWLAIYSLTILISLVRSPLPAMFIFLPYSLGAWHFVLTGVIQHASLAQDTLDHRHITRTVYINPVSAFIYWNMHYHVEHHTFPQVPYYNLPLLHEMLKPQLPKPYGSMWEAYKEMIPDLIKQASDPEHFTKREVPPVLELEQSAAKQASQSVPDKDGWVVACGTDEVEKGGVIRFDHGPRTFCVYHAADDGQFYATSGKCTHGAADLSEGLVEGNIVECPKHNGCFDFKTGMPTRLPVKTRLATFPTKVENSLVFVKLSSGKHMQISYDEEDKKMD